MSNCLFVLFNQDCYDKRQRGEDCRERDKHGTKESRTFARVHHEVGLPRHYYYVQQMTAPAHFCSREARANVLLLVTRIYSIRPKERVAYFIFWRMKHNILHPSMCRVLEASTT